ncbi:unnamed protein product [Peniophora sp. CBMAI 1063]|nr:unnamed protein product [Peniophora sp. CBMAI 1063]
MHGDTPGDVHCSCFLSSLLLPSFLECALHYRIIRYPMSDIPRVLTADFVKGSENGNPSPSSQSLSSDELEDAAVEADTLYEGTKDPAHLKDALDFIQRAIDANPMPHPIAIGWLGNCLRKCFQVWGEVDFLDRAIEVEHYALNLTDDGLPDKPIRLNNLGCSLKLRYQRSGAPDDLDWALQLHKKAVELIPGDGSDMQKLLVNLGGVQHLQFQHQADLGSLERAIEGLRRAIKLTPIGDPEEPDRLDLLLTCFHSRFEHLGDLDDLESAIGMQRRLIDLIPDDHPSMPVWLGNLALFMSLRYKYKGNIEDLEYSVVQQERVVELLSDEHPGKLTNLNNLGSILSLRFERLQEAADIERSISIHRRTLELATEDHPSLPLWLGSLALVLCLRWKRFGEIEDLQQGIAIQEQAIKMTPDGHPLEAARLDKLAAFLGSRFERLGTFEDLEKALQIQERAIELGDDKPLQMPAWLGNFANLLRHRYEHLADVRDLERAILLQEKVVTLTSHGHSDESLQLNNLSFLLRTRFRCLGNVEDLERAIDAQFRSVEYCSHDHPSTPTRLENLASLRQLRFERFGASDDLQSAILERGRALELTPDGHPDKPLRLSNLGGSLSSRFTLLGDPNDIHRAIAVRQQAINLTPDGHPRMAGLLDGLGFSRFRRFQRFGDCADLDSAVGSQKHAVQITSDGHSSLPTRLNNLASSLCGRFDRLKEPGDLKLAITLQRRAVELGPDTHPDMRTRLSTLGFTLSHRYKHFGQLEDLDAAITAFQHAAERTPEGHPDRPLHLHNLGTLLCTRFERLGENEDLERASVIQQSAVQLTPDGHPDMPVRVDQLSDVLFIHSQYYGGLDDLEGAVITACRALILTPSGHPSKLIMMNNLASRLRARFERSGDFEDLERALELQQRALELATGDSDDPYLLIGLSNLASTQCLLYGHFKRRTDLADAINTFRHAIDLIPPGYSGTSAIQRTLGHTLSLDLQFARVRETFDESLSWLMSAATQSLGSPYTHIDAVIYALTLHSEYSELSTRGGLLEAQLCLFDLIPEIVWLGYGVTRRFNEAQRVKGLISSTVSTVIGTGDLVQAMEWLEAGRSFVWAQVLSLRSPIDEVAGISPDIAGSLMQLHGQLQGSIHASLHRVPGTIRVMEHALPIKSLTLEVDRHRALAIEYDRLLKDIRTRPGLENFMRPKKLAALIPPLSHSGGYTVFIHIDVARCDALVLHQDGSIVAVPLRKLSLGMAEKLRANWKRYLQQQGVRAARMAAVPIDRLPKGCKPSTILGHLWRWIVHPVLQALGIDSKVLNGVLPHITWCPTGPLTQLPLHAAGIYQKGPGERVYDYVVSSFSPSLTALYRCADGLAKPRDSTSVLVVTQANAPGLPSIPGTIIEGKHLRKVFRDSGVDFTLLQDEEATIQAVKVAVPQNTWLHFACHGFQDPMDPVKSAFALSDGGLSLTDLMGTTAEHAELAFLSACQTAVGDEKIPEESMHLAAGMLAVGFKGVVATMWSIGDQDAPLIAEAYYKELLELRGSDKLRKGETGAAYALHEATKRLREKVGEQAFARWAPFVHFGV